MLVQVHFEDEGSSCRIGHKPGRPWSGVTAVVDFCTHSHKDTNNMNNGCTTVSQLVDAVKNCEKNAHTDMCGL